MYQFFTFKMFGEVLISQAMIWILDPHCLYDNFELASIPVREKLKNSILQKKVI